MRNPTVRTHRGLFGVSPHLKAPDCCRLAEFVGIVHVREANDRVALWACPCGTLVALHRHRVLWSLQIPEVALPLHCEKA